MIDLSEHDVSDGIVVIIDAAHDVEQSLLELWVREHLAVEHSIVRQTVLRIAREPEAIDAQPLIDSLSLPDQTILLPVRMVWNDLDVAPNSPPRFLDLLRGDIRRPSKMRAHRLLRKDPGYATCINAQPASLGALRARFTKEGGDAQILQSLAGFVANQAGIALDIAERKLRGGRYKVPRRVAQGLKASRRYQQALRNVSEETGESIAALEARAEDIFKELIATPRGFWQDVIAAFNRRIISMGYQPDFVIDRDKLLQIREVVRGKPSVLLWTHKTHIDGFAVFSMLFENDFPVPHLLGGVNMAFGGLGYAARRSGGIFIRRSFQDDPLYKMILRQYIGYLLEKRFPLSWAFEGTRSRVGKLMPPRYGLLKYVLEAAQASDSNDLHIIPVALNYDLIRDVKDYVKEQAGGVKRPESLRWFLGYLRGLRKPLGKIYIDFGEPIVLRDMPTEEDELGLKKIAFEVGVEANCVTPITLTSLVTTILLGHAPGALTRLELSKEMVRYLRWARARGIPLTSDFDRDALDDLNKLADVLGDHGLISRYDEGPDIIYAIVPEQHRAASYYRNTTIHHFVIKAIIELSLLHITDAHDDPVQALHTETKRLRDIFKFEFFYAPSDAFRNSVVAELQHIDADWQSTLAGGPAGANALLKRSGPLVARAVMLPYVEAYRVTAAVVARMPGEASAQRKQCVDQSLAYGKQAYLQRRISSEASIGKLLFENAFALLENRGLTEPQGLSLREARKQFLADLSALTERLDRLRLIMTPDSRW
ncbi:MAG: glycerol-3-phosphate 1-O-acyltransferase [Pseudomonadota bacterium]